jgi:hypothetical protein
MKTLLLIIVFGILLSSCKNYFFLEDVYARVNRKERFFLESYETKGIFCFPKIEFCHQIDHRANITGSRISFDPMSIGNSLNQSLSGLFQLSSCDEIKESFIIQDCSPRVEKNGNLSNDCCENSFVPKLIITSNSGKNTAGGGGLTFVEDMDDDRHLIEYKLITSIYQNDTLIYMDNRAYWTRLIAERGSRVQHHVPQEVIDTLVKLSLEEYFKRMK